MAENLSTEELKERLANTSCPNCSNKDMLVVELDGNREKTKNNATDEIVIIIRYCNLCDSCFGADDTMDPEDLQWLLEANKVTAKPTKMCSCGNDDVHQMFFRSIDESTGRPVVECQRCNAFTMLETVKYEDDEDGSSSESYGEKFECSDLEDQQSSSLVCVGCDIREDGLFDKCYDDRGRLKSFKCLSCDRENDASQCYPSFHVSRKDDLGQAQINSNKGSWGKSADVRQCQKCLNFFDQSEILMCRGCGTCNDALFDKNYDENGSMKFFICQGCDCKNSTSVWNAICPGCIQTDIEKSHISSEGSCDASTTCDDSRQKENYSGSCTRSTSQNSVPGKRISTRQKEATSLDDLYIGDHVAWHRDYAIWHHAIVTKVKSRDQMITVVHYTGGPRKHEGKYASVREEDVTVDLTKDKLYVYEYVGCSFDPETVVERARSRLGENRYNPVRRNCEHFARWCHTGVEYSNQVQSGLGRLVATVGNMASDALLTFDFFLNIAVEAGMFAYTAIKHHLKCKLKQITKTQFYRVLCESGCECTGGFLGALGGGLLGQLVIPVPFLGTLVGCSLGNLIGRFLGKIAGKKVAEKCIDDKGRWDYARF